VAAGLILTVSLLPASAAHADAYLLNEETYVECKTDEPTTWYGKAHGGSVEGGDAYFSDPRGLHSNAVVLDCGRA
jgi:hypothetical protein